MSELFSKRRFTTKIDPKHGDLILVSCCFVQGLIDAVAFNNWAVFAGMQTGNTVILALSTADYPTGQGYAWLLTLVSLVSFFIGSIFTIRVCKYFGSLKRMTITANFLFQAILIAITAGLVSGHQIPINDKISHAVDNDILTVAGIPALAWQSGATIASSRILGFSGEIPVNVLTSTYAALAADDKLFALHNRPRDRRVAACLMLFAGAIVATWIMKDSVGSLLVLWIAAGIKFIMAFSFAFLFEEEAKKVGDASP